MTETLIAGIGSPHGADRLGWAVIEALRHEDLPGPVKLVACSLPAELTPLLLEAPRAIVIDALLGDGPAGTLHQLSMADLPQVELRLSSHGLGLVDAVRLACVLGMPAERLTVLALDVARPEAELQEAWVTRLCERVSLLLQRAA
ncbi:hydrogenase maturation protease [Uliginosibacterium aquaticum]|uniref:Hydrogenase maturation protease n=1 Tax=Uliginosibacterium aquaticum TaxID=2731212 RepID=A0ABX2INX3_9RHOO|nr:hydrogenase maturation protease [Uliginosibacterium aquaticum]NSL56712.1 hydrogenase maturation protease [Uliginosibacterium aquaticum]